MTTNTWHLWVADRLRIVPAGGASPPVSRPAGDAPGIRESFFLFACLAAQRFIELGTLRQYSSR